METATVQYGAGPAERFAFQERHGKLDLRAISRIDIDKIVQETDIDALQAHLANITFSKLDVADLKRCMLVGPTALPVDEHHHSLTLCRSVLILLVV